MDCQTDMRKYHVAIVNSLRGIIMRDTQNIFPPMAWAALATLATQALAGAGGVAESDGHL